MTVSTFHDTPNIRPAVHHPSGRGPSPFTTLGNITSQNDLRDRRWTEQRRYMGIEILAKARLTVIAGDPTHSGTEPTTAAIAA